MGGLVAYHIAVLLEKMDKTIGLVIIVDQKPKEKYGKFNFWADNIWKGSHMMKMNIALRHDKYKKEKKYLAQGFYGLLGKITGAQSELKDNEAGPVSPDVVVDPNARKLIRELDLHMKASVEYAAPTFGGKIHVLRCEEMEKKDYAEDMYQKWKTLANQTTFSTIPGNHYTCMKEPTVQEVASEITRIMDVAIFKTTGVTRETRETKARKMRILSVYAHNDKNSIAINQAHSQSQVHLRNSLTTKKEIIPRWN